MIDYHMHSRLCRHGKGDIFEYVESAIAKGLQEIGFAEHIPIPGLDDPTGRMIIDDWDVYVKDVFDARERYPEIKIAFGIEADYLPPFMNYIEKFIHDYPFDYIIGSVHFIDDWDFSNPEHRYRLEEFGLDYLHKRYYELLAEAAVSGLFDVIGHFDLPKRVGPVSMDKISDKIDAALQAIHKQDLVLDINTSGLRKEPQEIYPGTEILKRARRLQIPVIMGSDAHSPKEVAADFEPTLILLKEIGYDHICRFENRERQLMKI